MNCCSPGGQGRSAGASAPARVQAPTAAAPNGAVPPHDDVMLTGGIFRMGDSFGEGYAEDGEWPVHEVSLEPFRVDATAVTNQQWAAFVEATGYKSESELYGFSAVFHLAVQAGPGDILNSAAGTPWWLSVRGADWAHPAGPGSSWKDIPDHPVTQVSWHDAQAYCRWAGRRLPTEAEWEFAARGGREGQRFPWGNDLLGQSDNGDPAHRCNIWQGTFPVTNTREDGYLTTAAVRSFPPNGYGLYEVSGNVWEWCQDWFHPGYYRNSPKQDPKGPVSGAGRVMRGGSYLCHHSYCNRYRVAARTLNTPDSASGNIGFRTVAKND